MKNPVFDTDNWKEIFATLARNKTRTFLTAFGIFWGTAMLAMLWGGASGLEGMMKRNFQGFATNMGGMFPLRTTKPYKGFKKGIRWTLKLEDVDYFRRICPILESSSTLTNQLGSYKYADKSASGQLQGVEGDYFTMQIPIIYEGRVINRSDVSGVRKVVALGKNLASELFGNASPIGKQLEINGIYFRVIGVIGQQGEASLGGRLDDSAIVPSSTLQRAYNKGNEIDGFIFTAKPGHTPTEAKAWLWRAITANHPIDPTDDNAMWFMDVSEMFAMVDNLFMGISLLALFVGLGTLLAGVIGVGNIMWIIVKERTQEIGIRRAIGARPSDIIAQILTESITLTAISGIAGVCFATLVLAVANHITYDPVLGSAHFELHFSHAVGIVLAFLVLGSLAGMVPALKAMRIKPVEALNDK
ncbi:MAG: ABC transporter permease [Firmicutes bacterium]|nr:ABC transporter permease [Bacillota bacterium]MCM1402076.1 ABC transporter permease [Bacteroides sp.]MCM1477999.1 ABC transporter permease [Bacteroides sp.]